MVAAKTASLGEMEAAFKAYTEAEKALDEAGAENKMELMQTVAQSASTILRSIFGRSKAAAIAAAIIDTLAAIAKALSAYPFPWNLAPAAAAAAVGYANVAKIRSQNAEGFASGTPGLDFAGFGRETMAALHNQEAVIPRGKGHLLASEIAAALPSETGFGTEQLDHISETLDALPYTLTRAWKSAMVSIA
jgi:hypothetical protein